MVPKWLWLSFFNSKYLFKHKIYYKVLGTHLEIQHTLKNDVALNLSAHNKFHVNRAFKGLFRLRCDSSKVVLFLNKYLNIYCVIISLRDSFGAQTNLKKSLRQKLSPFKNLCQNRAFKGLFWHRRGSSKVYFLSQMSIKTYNMLK